MQILFVVLVVLFLMLLVAGGALALCRQAHLNDVASLAEFDEMLRNNPDSTSVK